MIRNELRHEKTCYYTTMDYVAIFAATTFQIIQFYFKHIYRGYYTSGHFILNLSNELSASLINFI